MLARLKSNISVRLLLSTDPSWSSRFLRRCYSKCDKSYSDVDGNDEETERRRSLPVITGPSLPRQAQTVEEFVKTKFGAGRLFDNPLDRRPDIIYHHRTQYSDYNDYTNCANVYETINHQENSELSSSK